MRILVTGARGFLGRHLLPELAMAGHSVVGVDREDGDLTASAVADSLLIEEDFEVVVHLAAAVGRILSEDDIERTIRTNALATAHVARACARHGARLVYVSTSEIYGDQGERVCEEDGPTALPHNIYGLTKRWGEEVARLYAPAGLQVIRPSMPYGPGLPVGRGRAAIANMLWQAATRQEIPVHRGGVRAWCWVGDTIRGFRMVIENGEPGAWNVGRDDNFVTMRDVAELACQITGAPANLIREIDPPAAQTVVKRLSMAKLRALGWQPTVDLEQGMRWTCEFVRLFDRTGERRPAFA